MKDACLEILTCPFKGDFFLISRAIRLMAEESGNPEFV
jgi:hypothetical protein